MRLQIVYPKYYFVSFENSLFCVCVSNEYWYNMKLSKIWMNFVIAKNPKIMHAISSKLFTVTMDSFLVHIFLIMIFSCGIIVHFPFINVQFRLRCDDIIIIIIIVIVLHKNSSFCSIKIPANTPKSSFLYLIGIIIIMRGLDSRKFKLWQYFLVPPHDYVNSNININILPHKITS